MIRDGADGSMQMTAKAVTRVDDCGTMGDERH
jgi:hypothetical protein